MKSVANQVASISVYQAISLSEDAITGNDRLYRTRGNLPSTKIGDIFSKLDQGYIGIAFGSGNIAFQNLLHLLKPGDAVIAVDASRGGESMVKREGITIKYVSTLQHSVIDSLRSETKLIWIEMNHDSLKVSDLALIAFRQLPPYLRCAWIALLLLPSYNRFVRWELQN